MTAAGIGKLGVQVTRDVSNHLLLRVQFRSLPLLLYGLVWL